MPWIEIPVPPLVSEELFQAVQHQLDENRETGAHWESGRLLPTARTNRMRALSLCLLW